MTGERNMDKPEPSLGGDWRWVLELHERPRTSWSALELRSHEAIKQLVWERQQLLERLATIE